MKISTIACVSVISLVSGVALASNTPTFGPNSTNVPIGPPYVPSDCAAGFNKSGVTGTPTSGAYGWKCKTPLIICPPAPPGMTGGLGTPTATPSGKGAVFQYFCSWLVPPK